MHSVDEKFKNNLDNSIWHSFMLEVHINIDGHDTPVRVHRSLGNMLRSSLWDNLEVSLWSSLRYSLEQTAQNAQSVEETNDA